MEQNELLKLRAENRRLKQKLQKLRDVQIKQQKLINHLTDEVETLRRSGYAATASPPRHLPRTRLRKREGSKFEFSATESSSAGAQGAQRPSNRSDSPPATRLCIQHENRSLPDGVIQKQILPKAEVLTAIPQTLPPTRYAAVHQPGTPPPTPSKVALSPTEPANRPPMQRPEAEVCGTPGSAHEWHQNAGHSTSPVVARCISSPPLAASMAAVRERKFESVVRNKDDRRQLRGFECAQCARFYKLAGLDAKDIDNVSRHRHRHTPPSTPDGYWDDDFTITSRPSQLTPPL